MDGLTDFSIQRILSPQLGLRAPGKDVTPDRDLRGFTAPGLWLSSGNLPAPAPVPIPGPGCLQFGGMSYGDMFYYGGFYPVLHFRDRGGDPGYHGHFMAGVHAPPPPTQQQQHQQQHQQQQQRQKTRMRTVFTDSQSKHLEALFALTDYPAVEARAEVARNTGLSEETVRVWFKNRRARRKRQRGGSKVTGPTPDKLFTCLL